MKTNSEDMTFREWMRAANAFGVVIDEVNGRRAWQNGEDPTEYAAKG